MHELDLRLIGSAGVFVSGCKRLKISGPLAEALEEAIRHYKIACGLARGPDEKRALRWSEEAAVRQAKLKRLLKRAAKAAR